jgi:hypothetical protein
MIKSMNIPKKERPWSLFILLLVANGLIDAMWLAFELFRLMGCFAVNIFFTAVPLTDGTLPSCHLLPVSLPTILTFSIFVGLQIGSIVIWQRKKDDQFALWLLVASIACIFLLPRLLAQFL